VGELALTHGHTGRAATVVAETDLRTLEFPASAFRAALASDETLRRTSPPSSGSIPCPNGASVTQHGVAFSAPRCITTIYHLNDGRTFTSGQRPGVADLRLDGA